MMANRGDRDETSNNPWQIQNCKIIEEEEAYKVTCRDEGMAREKFRRKKNNTSIY